MNTLLRAVVSGFGFSLGAALYKKMSKQLGIDEEKKESGKNAAAEEATEAEIEDGEPA